MKSSKLLYVILIVFICVCGCTDKQVIEDEKEEYSLISSENRLVFKKEDNYEVYYLSDGVTKIEKVKAFLNSDYANTYYGTQNELDYKSIRCVDSLVIFEMNDEYLEDYKYLSRTDIMLSMIESDFEYVEK